MLSCEQLDIEAGNRMLVRGLAVRLRPGDFVALLGPNGSGKSLTLHALAGLRPARGTVTLDGRPLAQWRRRLLARRLGLLLQDDGDALPLTVFESALLGRHPHGTHWLAPRGADRELTRAALDMLELGELADRETSSLSGGERRRLGIARLLAQDPSILLLDEPTNHLDPRHQVGVLSRLAGLAAGGRAVVASLHDPFLALRFAATTLLLHGDGRWRLGPTREVVTTETLEELFATPYENFRSADDGHAVLPRAPAASA